MSLSYTTSTEPLFKNYSRSYVYTNIPLKYTPLGETSETESLIRINQRLADAEPYIFRDEDNWVFVNDNIPKNGEDEARPISTTPDETELNNMYKFGDDGRRVIGVISGNIYWDPAEISELYRLNVSISLKVSSNDYSTNMSVSPKTDTDTYYFTLTVPSENRNINIESKEDLYAHLSINGALWDAEDDVVTTRVSHKLEPSDDFKSFTLTEIPTPTGDVTFFECHAIDFTVMSTKRRMIFNSLNDKNLPEKLRRNKSTVVQPNEEKTTRAYADQAGWGDNYVATQNNTEYRIIGWQVENNPNDIRDLKLTQNFKIDASPFNIKCSPLITMNDDPIVVTIPKNDKREWAEKNTTNKDRSGTFGAITYSLPGAVNGTRATVKVYLTVNSSNQKSTKTGLNNTGFINTYKGGTSETKNILVTIVNGKINVNGNWYLQSGSWNYLHPKEKNWHNGSGSFTIKSITYQKLKT